MVGCNLPKICMDMYVPPNQLPWFAVFHLTSWAEFLPVCLFVGQNTNFTIFVFPRTSLQLFRFVLLPTTTTTSTRVSESQIHSSTTQTHTTHKHHYSCVRILNPLTLQLVKLPHKHLCQPGGYFYSHRNTIYFCNISHLSDSQTKELV